MFFLKSESKPRTVLARVSASAPLAFLILSSTKARSASSSTVDPAAALRSRTSPKAQACITRVWYLVFRVWYLLGHLRPGSQSALLTGGTGHWCCQTQLSRKPFTSRGCPPLFFRIIREDLEPAWFCHLRLFFSPPSICTPALRGTLA